MFINGFVNLFHQCDRLGQSCYYLLVVLDVIELEFAPLAILEPLLTDLVAADVKLPRFGQNALNILCLVDPDSALYIL